VRIVSLVPSLTETLWELGVGHQVVGVTKFCVRPREARDRAAVVGGTKDPSLDRIRDLRPDLVLADEDENKPEHLEALSAFARVHVTRIASVADAARELAAVGRLVDREFDAEARAQRILERAGELAAVAATFPPLRVFVPIWRTPLMTIDAATYMGDLVRVAGGRNVFAGSTRKYFQTSFDEARMHAPDAVLLPTEPYRFTEVHRREFVQALDLPLDRVLLVDGEAFTWFGVRTLDGLDAIAAAMVAVRGAASWETSRAPPGARNVH
jgi:ABC-type Fe3+-hydroxamate transport system substrate-binding protein